MKPFAAFIDVRYLGFYGIINNGGEAGTHPLNAICTASPTLRGFSNPGLQTASSPGCHYSDTPPATRVQGTEGPAPRCGGQDLVPFPIQQPLVNRHHQLPTKNILPSCSLSLASNSHSQTRGTLARRGVILLQHLPEPRCKAQSLSLKVTAVPFAIQNSSSILWTTAPLRPRSGDCRQTDPLSFHGACRQDQTSAVCYATEEA